MKREYDFSKAKRGPLRNLPPMSEVDRHTKVRITIMLDLDLLKFFKSRAASRGAQPYQTQINQALREYVAAHRESRRRCRSSRGVHLASGRTSGRVHGQAIEATAARHASVAGVSGATSGSIVGDRRHGAPALRVPAAARGVRGGG